MPRGKKAAAPAATAPENGTANGKPANKMEGVQRALDTLGQEAKPLQIQGWLKDTYKIKMPVSTISNYKSTLQRGGGKKKGRLGRPKGSKTKAVIPGGISVDDIRAIKELADRLGAEKVRQLAEVLAK